MCRVEAASVIPTGGGAVAIVIASIFVAVVCAMIAIETNHNLYGWMLVGFVGSLQRPISHQLIDTPLAPSESVGVMAA